MIQLYTERVFINDEKCYFFYFPNMLLFKYRGEK